MKNKNEVYVVVDTPKKAEKLKKVLDMFGEEIFRSNSIDVGYDLAYNDLWFNKSISRRKDSWHDEVQREEVSIKELKQILAKEHLKIGDYVVLNGGLKGKVVRFIGNSEILILDYENDNVTCLIKDFKRYATPQEIESALIKEAKRIGNKYDVYSWNHEQNTLYGNRGNDVGHDILFENGKWEEVIKPEEKPKVGDVVKAWDNKQDAYTIGKVIKINSIGYFLQDDLWWDNAKTLTQQEVIDLLFNK